MVELRTYKYKKQQLAMIRSQLDYLEQSNIKVSKYDDEAAGDRVNLHDQYMKLMDKKDRLKLEELQLRLDISAVDRALEDMAVTMPYQKNAIVMRYVENKQISFIGSELGFSDRTTSRKIEEGIRELNRLLKMIR